MNGQQPVKQYRMSGIQVSIWANRSGSGHIFYSVKIKRTYKDTDGTWKQSESFSAADMAIISYLGSWAANWIAATEETHKQRGNANGSQGQNRSNSHGNSSGNRGGSGGAPAEYYPDDPGFSGPPVDSGYPPF